MEVVENKKFRIVLVEDNPDHAELVMRNFECSKRPCEIKWLRDGHEAREFFFSRVGESAGEYHETLLFDLVILDLKLPCINGMELLEMLKKSDELKKVPVIILTTSDAERDIAAAYSANANSYIVKPDNFADYSRLTDLIDQYWLLWNRSARRFCD